MTAPFEDDLHDDLDDGEGEGDPLRRRVAELATAALRRRSAWMATADGMLADPAVAEAVELLRGLDAPALADLIVHAREELPGGVDLVVIACCLEAGPAAAPELAEAARRLLGFGPHDPPARPFAVRVVRRLPQGQTTADDLLHRLPAGWASDPVVGPYAAEQLARALADGPGPDRARLERAARDEDDDDAPPPALAVVDALAAHLDADAGSPLAELGAQLALLGDVSAYVRVIGARALAPHGLVEVAPLVAAADELVALVDREPRGSALVAGAPGSGRSALIALAALRLRERGWTIAEVHPSELNAGQIYVGALDGRLIRLAQRLRGRRVALVMPGFDTALTAGRATRDPRSVADRLVPALVRGDLVVLGELTGEGARRLPRECPALARAVPLVETPALGDDDLLRIAAHAGATAAEGAPLETPATVLEGALALTRHLLPHRALPGAIATVARRAVLALRADDDAAGTLRHAHVITALGALTGMPRAVLDDAAPLDLEALRAAFTERVLGQTEAVDCLVERVALIKAGLCDPLRPYGAFLFVGPTGTGKTELARQLAQALFGSPDRLVRIDMTELRDPASVDRLIGAGDDDGPQESLATRVRAEPFCVVLLDEFEKAAPPIWDLFLQVLDAGRLTDRAGGVIDFRQTIVIATSNLGAAIDAPRALGFGELEGAAFGEERVLRAVRETLRPELVNRFDRVVVFRPLSRTVMRAIVRGEVRAALGRRGLALREWAIEVDESAIDHLLERGFTPDLGARPLRRAVERYLLAPIARAIVARDAPRGEQFLLVTAGARGLDVTFVAADADPEPAAPVEEAQADGEPTPVALARDPQGTRAELLLLRGHIEAFASLTGGSEWEARKDAALAMTAARGFWDDPARFAVLARAEVMERIEAQVRAARSLLERLLGLARSPGARLDPAPVARLARDVVQLERALATELADGEQDAVVVLAAASGEHDRSFLAELAAMYEAWATAAGATARAVHAGGEGRRALVLEGLGAHAALAPEGGLHVLERATGSRTRRVATVAVEVAPWRGHDPGAPDGVGALARSLAVPVARRYQREPSPLVRDRARGGRTGRLERVLAGGFDLLGDA